MIRMILGDISTVRGVYERSRKIELRRLVFLEKTC